MVSLALTIVVGFLVGLAARAILPGRQITGIFGTTVLGVGGALVAGYAGQLLGYYKVGEPMGFVAAVVGALVVLFLWSLIFNR
ncbi:MAG: GlsB/YeaQ/YmgE family stress response membrane protein [Burkholderiales bacterium]